MLNTVTIMGRLTKAPELRSTQSGVPVTSVSIACDRDIAAKGEEKKTDFFEVTAWRHTAEFLCKYFDKGSMVAINGRLQTSIYEKSGERRQSVFILAESIYFAEGRKNAQSDLQSGSEQTQGVPVFTEYESEEELPF